MLDGKAGHPGWAWIFIVEGALTLGVGKLLIYPSLAINP